MFELLIGRFKRKRIQLQGGPIGVYAVRQMTAVQSDSSAGIYNVSQKIAVDKGDYSAGIYTIRQLIARADPAFDDIEHD